MYLDHYFPNMTAEQKLANEVHNRKISISPKASVTKGVSERERER